MTSECEHYAYECMYGSHTCADCRTYLGTLLKPLVPHNAVDCGICGPSSEHENMPCVLPHPCPNKSYADRVSRKRDKFVTKDSGVREDYDSGMRRDTQAGKPRFDLMLIPDMPYEDQFLTRVAALLERGAEKYGERNWQLANSEEELARFKASGLRHMMQWLSGELDEDHAAAVVFNLMAAEYVKWKLNADT